MISFLHILFYRSTEEKDTKPASSTKETELPEHSETSPATSITDKKQPEVETKSAVTPKPSTVKPATPRECSQVKIETTSAISGEKIQTETSKSTVVAAKPPPLKSSKSAAEPNKKEAQLSPRLDQGIKIKPENVTNSNPAPESTTKKSPRPASGVLAAKGDQNLWSSLQLQPSNP